MINEAKKAVAGLQMMSEVIDNIHARRPDIVEDALEKVLGIKEGASEEAFNAAMDSRVEEVTHFDKYTDRIKELEGAIGDLLLFYAYESGKDNEGDMAQAVDRAQKLIL